MKTLDLFKTPIFTDVMHLDRERLETKIRKFSKETKNLNYISNVGGFQGDDFRDEKFTEALKNVLPISEEHPLKNIRAHVWANINGTGHSNSRHHHFVNEPSMWMSGVYYVKVHPAAGGRIRFWDPRGPWVRPMFDHLYYGGKGGGGDVYVIQPHDGMVIFFPPWLEHDVEPNMSKKDRISISFNIHAFPDGVNIEEYLSMRKKSQDFW